MDKLVTQLTPTGTFHAHQLCELRSMEKAQCFAGVCNSVIVQMVSVAVHRSRDMDSDS